MNQVVISQLIYKLCIDKEDKYDLALLLEGMKDVIRINVKAGDTCISATRSALVNLGLQFSEVIAPPKEGYICGLIVSKSKKLIKEFETANRKGENNTMIKLFGYCLKFPMEMPKKGTEEHKALSAINKIVPALYTSLTK